MRRAWAAAAALTIGLCMNGAGQESDKKSEGFWASKKSAWVGLPAAQKDQVFKFAEDYKAYLAAARTADT